MLSRTIARRAAPLRAVAQAARPAATMQKRFLSQQEIEDPGMVSESAQLGVFDR